ncbi:o-succinylbenzoate synthase [Maribacter algicola]|uniref:O-succinylbenzoate synthase n=1 Tax=Meishania litoralis TaxID=3434685 RepID=A0ACC7LQ21_9FLAO
MKASYKKYILDFKRPSGTSRGVMLQKETWFIILEEQGKFGIGECGLLKGLSIDDVPDYEKRLAWVCDNIAVGKTSLLSQLQDFPSIQFGIEQAFLSFASDHPFRLFASDFLEKEQPININGLVWMGDERFMHEQIQRKINDGFTCIKMKIGALNFETELKLLRSIRNEYSKEQIELRVDANGAFKSDEAFERLSVLAELDLHSVEQPIAPGDWKTMQRLCKNTPLPIALDEELIGVSDVTQKESLIRTIKPQHIILKPSLIGGCQRSQEWIDLADKYGIGWWVTSALESNIGLNAIAQWAYTAGSKIPQGLGTGSLYKNNFDSPLQVEKGNLYYRQNKTWNVNLIRILCT